MKLLYGLLAFDALFVVFMWAISKPKTHERKHRWSDEELHKLGLR